VILADLQDKLHHQFHNPDLLQQALTHRSYLNEHPEYQLGHNERLEFLGDAVLDFVVSDMLFIRFADMPEGRMTRLRAALVRTESLAKISLNFGVGDLLLMAKGEEESGGRTRITNLCNAFEAVIGALYLDDGMVAVQNLLIPLFTPILEEVLTSALDKDAKSRFQEWSQAIHGITPVYQTIYAVGDDHDKLFTVELWMGAQVVGWGTGKSKQIAEQAAAQQALQDWTEEIE
jgi:ribonuclease III